MSDINTDAVFQIRALAGRYRMQAKAAHASGFGYAQRAAQQFFEEDDCTRLALDLEAAALQLEKTRDPEGEALDVRPPTP